jgi:hypothetical protein
MLLSVARRKLQQMSDVDRVHAVLQHDLHSNFIRSVDAYSRFCTKQLGRSKVCANWMPCMLNEDQYATNVLLATADFQ